VFEDANSMMDCLVYILVEPCNLLLQALGVKYLNPERWTGISPTLFYNA
jgi:hypothetical protein